MVNNTHPINAFLIHHKGIGCMKHYIWLTTIIFGTWDTTVNIVKLFYPFSVGKHITSIILVVHKYIYIFL